ncbi:hypothetical protein [Paenarthrobacter sp. CAP02]|uniref:hypothetical protein n=1 Tax=Paenarthrobacter sp. CAP02 TaxID=3158144 RepID=UPI0032DAC0F8
MHAEPQGRESAVTAGKSSQSRKRKLPDPPDPDNLPIDYPGSGWDSGSYPTHVPPALRPRYAAHHKSV